MTSAEDVFRRKSLAASYQGEQTGTGEGGFMGTGVELGGRELVDAWLEQNAVAVVGEMEIRMADVEQLHQLAAASSPDGTYLFFENDGQYQAYMRQVRNSG